MYCLMRVYLIYLHITIITITGNTKINITNIPLRKAAKLQVFSSPLVTKWSVLPVFGSLVVFVGSPNMSMTAGPCSKIVS